MKLLIDQNISHRIISKMGDTLGILTHVRDLNWINYPDITIFRNARNLGYDAIITLDEDFNKIILELSIPPKVIWLRIGNCSTNSIALALFKNIDIIHSFMNDNEHDCLEIY
jgi:predicted nuclease of predicted toxin-antitoxin system